MPSTPALLTVTGLSSTAGFGNAQNMWVPDYDVRPFNIGIRVEVNSTGAQTLSVEHTFDYIGAFSSNFNGFVSSAAVWQANTGINGVSLTSSAIDGNYAFPVTAIRLNVTAGSSLGTARCILIQAG